MKVTTDLRRKPKDSKTFKQIKKEERNVAYWNQKGKKKKRETKNKYLNSRLDDDECKLKMNVGVVDDDVKGVVEEMNEGDAE